MISHSAIEDKLLRSVIRNGAITIAGNSRLKIYGLLTCGSGKRMKRDNRAFFKNITEAITNGYRPCGHCLPQAYKKWKHEPV